MNAQNLILLGATGSIGTQTAEIVRAHPDDFRLVGLSAGHNIAAATRLAVEFGVPVLAIANAGDSTPTPADPVPTSAQHPAVAQVRAALAQAAAGLGMPDPVTQILVGPRAAATLAAHPADIVLNAITGAAGLAPTFATLDAGTDVALANKESLIMGGQLVLDAAAATGASLIPVDSEHSAVAQALRSGTHGEVARLVITASGGPFRGMRPAQLEHVTPAEALAHPTWDMGTVITTNSATLVNKGLEVIEAHLLFDISYDAIDVVVHPQSQVHSMVEFRDGATIAQVSPPDMRLPIAYALSRGTRLDRVAAGNDWTVRSQWTFEPVDSQAFPALDVLIAAGRRGATAPAAANAANEELVAAFHAGHIPFTGIAAGLAHVLAAHSHAAELNRAAVYAADAAARAKARAWIRDVALTPAETHASETNG